MDNGTASKPIIKRIACVQLDNRLPDFCKKAIMPRYGLPVIAAVLDDAGYEVKVFIEHVAEPDIDWILGADILLLSTLTGAANKTYNFAETIRSHKSMPIILGGEHASSFTADALRWVDYVLRGEGDTTILHLIEALQGLRPFDEVSGLSWNTPNGPRHNSRTAVPDNINIVHDLALIHDYPQEDGLPLFFKRGMVKLICVQATRGCPFTCSFCVAPRLFGYTYRYRDVDAIMQDIRIKLPYGRNFLFTDNLFAINPKATNNLLDSMIDEGVGDKAEFTCFCRVEIYKKPKLLEKMYRAGFRYICLGMESIDDNTLAGIEKRQTTQEMINAISGINATGIRVSGSFIAGNEGDNAGALSRVVDFAIDNDMDSLHFISLWYYPGDPRCPLIPQRIIIPSFDYCTGSFVTHFPDRMRPSTLQRSIVDAQRKYWNPVRALKSAAKGDFRYATHLLSHRYAYSAVERAQLSYAEHLETIEHGYYNKSEELISERIINRPLDAIVQEGLKAAIPGLDSQKNVSSSGLESQPLVQPIVGISVPG